MNKFKQLCLLLCCSFVFLNGFYPVTSYAADYTPVISQGRFSVPLLVNREEFIEAGYYRDSYIVTETFSITGLPWNSTIRGNVGMLRQTNCRIYDFINSVQGNHYIHVQGSVQSIQTNNSNGEFISYYSGNELCNFRADNFGETFENNDNNWYTIAYGDYFAGSSDIQVSVTYYVTVYSTAKSYKIEFMNNWVILDNSTVTVESGNTINSADITNQDYLRQIQQSVSNMETLQQQNNQLLHDAIDKIEYQYSVSEQENFGVDEIVDELNEKAGALTFATDCLIDFLDLFDSDNKMSTTITFPSFTINVQGVDYEVWDEYEYDLSDLEDNFNILLESVRWGTTMLVYVALISYIGKCWDTILGG